MQIPARERKTPRQQQFRGRRGRRSARRRGGRAARPGRRRRVVPPARDRRRPRHARRSVCSGAHGPARRAGRRPETRPSAPFSPAARPEAVLWLASRAISYMDETGFPEAVGAVVSATARPTALTATGRAARAGARAEEAPAPRGTARARPAPPPRPRRRSARCRGAHAPCSWPRRDRPPSRRRPWPRPRAGRASRAPTGRAVLRLGDAAREDALVLVPELDEDDLDRRVAPKEPAEPCVRDGLALAVGEHDREPLLRLRREVAEPAQRRERVQRRRPGRERGARRRPLDADRALEGRREDLLVGAREEVREHAVRERREPDGDVRERRANRRRRRLRALDARRRLGIALREHRAGHVEHDERLGVGAQRAGRSSTRRPAGRPRARGARRRRRARRAARRARDARRRWSHARATPRARARPSRARPATQSRASGTTNAEREQAHRAA